MKTVDYLLLTLTILTASCSTPSFNQVKGTTYDEIFKGKKAELDYSVGDKRYVGFRDGLGVFQNNLFVKGKKYDLGQPNVKVTVESRASESGHGKKVFIFSGDPKVRPNTLEFKGYKKIVEKGLRVAGFKISKNPKEYDYFIYLKYGISEPNVEVKQKFVPIFGFDGPSSSTTYLNSPTGNSATAHTYNSGAGAYLAGGYTKSWKEVTYKRYLSLAAYKPNKKNAKVEKDFDQVWTVVTLSTGRSGDLRMIYPSLVGASIDYMGQDSGKTRNHLLNIGGFYNTMISLVE
jgi:hypothetical protein